MAPASVREAARAYARRGWPVLPLWWPGPKGACACGRPDCGRAGKHPIAALVPHGLHDASADPAQVERWWRIAPLANLGVRTGGASGLVVLDVDGPTGVRSLRRLVEAHGPLAAAWSRTATGWHAWMAHRGKPVPCSAGRLGPGLDVRGEGGFIVAPPSLHATGKRYRWLRPAAGELPPAPAWLVQQARPEPIRAPAPVRVMAGRRWRYAEAALEAEAREVAATPPGQRNQRLNLAAFRLGGLVGASLLGEEAAREALVTAALGAGLSRREAEATVRSGLRAGARQPREVEPAAPDPGPRRAEPMEVQR
jgi:hypothetical protein